MQMSKINLINLLFDNTFFCYRNRFITVYPTHGFDSHSLLNSYASTTITGAHNFLVFFP